MKDSRINAFIAGTALIAAILMAAALSYAIGKWSFGSNGHTYILKFPTATGITPNAEVKLAGAPVGRVVSLKLIPLKDQDQDPRTSLYNCIEVIIDVNKDVEVDNGVEATIKQDGFGIAPKYILLMPGADHNAGPLADNSVVQGEMPFDLSDLLQPAGEALEQAKVLVAQLQPALQKLGPIMDRMDSLTDELKPMIAQGSKMITHGDKLLTDTDNVVQVINTPDGRKHLQTIIDSLAVSTQNLKVVSYNAKALTATLAQKPWRVFWGGSTIPAPSEDQALKSNKVIRLQQRDVQVAPTTTNNPTFNPPFNPPLAP